MSEATIQELVLAAETLSTLEQKVEFWNEYFGTQTDSQDVD